jgi:hypothetical protein
MNNAQDKPGKQDTPSPPPSKIKNKLKELKMRN